MKISYLHLAGAVLALTACASNPPDAASEQKLAAAEVASVPVDVVSTPTDDEDALVCTQTRVIGTLIPKRVCKSKAQIEEERLSGRAYTESLQGPGPSRDPALPRDTGKFSPPID